MNPDEFRRHGHDVIDWIAGYLENIRDYPVVPACEPGALAEALPAEAPEQGEPMERILADFQSQIVPANTHWNHPRFFAYFSITGSPPGILGETLAAALNVNGMLWKSSPAVTELEQVTMRWLRQWMGIEGPWFGLIYDTASISTLHAIAAARERMAPECHAEGNDNRLRVYTSEHAHSSVEKAAITLGMGQRNVIKIPVDAEFRMRPDALADQIAADRAAGLRPCCVTATVGTTSVTSVDPVPAIADLCEKENIWLHIDCAYGGVAGIVPEYRHYLNGVERADSFVVNPHKWLFTPTDLSAFYTRHPGVLRNAFALVPEYLRTKEDGRVVNLMDYGVQLGRRFRALKLWFVMRHYGREGVIALVRRHIEHARWLAAKIVADERFELCAPVTMSLVCFRRKGEDELNKTLLEQINASGKAFLSPNVLNQRYVLRWAIGNAQTTRQDLAETWALIQSLA
jgi:aromatic-L-amino-acid decarboxylase